MKLAQIAISIAVILFVVWVGDKQRNLAGLVAAMPLTIPLTLWIVYANTGGDRGKTGEFAAGALTSILGTVVFVVVCYLLLRTRLHIAFVIAGGYAAWATVILLIPYLARQATHLLAVIQR